MSKDMFTALAKYSAAVNTDIVRLIKASGPEAWDREFGGYFKSIHGICSHLYLCDHNWLKRFEALRSFKAAAGLGKPYVFGDFLFKTLEEYALARAALDSRMSGFIEELTAADLQATLRYTNNKGESLEKPVPLVLSHLFNHGTHHRGAISVYLDMLGCDNDFSGIAKYV